MKLDGFRLNALLEKLDGDHPISPVKEGIKGKEFPCSVFLQDRP
jgi:hypothetical protein